MPPGLKSWLFYSATAFVASAAAAIVLRFLNISPLILGLIGVNIGAFFVFFIDKVTAPKNGLRLPEMLSYFLAIIGGGPGIIAGMHLFRHKTRKASFQLIITLIFFVELMVVKLILWAP